MNFDNYNENNNFVPEPTCKKCDLTMKMIENWEENTKKWQCIVCEAEIPIKDEY